MKYIAQPEAHLANKQASAGFVISILARPISQRGICFFTNKTCRGKGAQRCKVLLCVLSRVTLTAIPAEGAGIPTDRHSAALTYQRSLSGIAGAGKQTRSIRLRRWDFQSAVLDGAAVARITEVGSSTVISGALERSASGVWSRLVGGLCLVVAEEGRNGAHNATVLPWGPCEWLSCAVGSRCGGWQGRGSGALLPNALFPARRVVECIANTRCSPASLHNGVV